MRMTRNPREEKRRRDKGRVKRVEIEERAERSSLALSDGSLPSLLMMWQGGLPKRNDVSGKILPWTWAY